MTINAKNPENRRWQWSAKYREEYHYIQTHCKYRIIRAFWRELVEKGELTPNQLKFIQGELEIDTKNHLHNKS